MCILSMALMSDVEDLIGNFISWPPSMRDLMMSNHLSYATRFKLTLFLLGNALPPSVIRKWYTSQKCLRDVSAHNHVESMIADFKQDKLSKYKYFNMWSHELLHCSSPTGMNWAMYD